MEVLMFENLFVTAVLALSGSYIFRRLHRMSQAGKSKAPACNSCSSGSCGTTPAAEPKAQGETPLRMS